VQLKFFFKKKLQNNFSNTLFCLNEVLKVGGINSEQAMIFSNLIFFTPVANFP
jgi:hypothetical protein